MARLIGIPFNELKETLPILDAAGWTCEDFDELRRPGNAALALEAVRNALARGKPASEAPVPAALTDLPATRDTIDVGPPATPLTRRIKRTLVADERFISPEEQVELVWQWNRERDWGLTREDFDSLGAPPRWPEEPLSAVVLEICLRDTDKDSSVRRTLIELAAVIGSQHKLNLQITPDVEIALLPGVNLIPGLHWRRVRLAANWNREQGVSPAAVPDTVLAPHVAILSAAALFPKWLASMDGTETPNIFVNGFRIANGDGQLTQVLVIERLALLDKVCIYPDRAERADKRFAVPEMQIV